jgi:hypothetical protein
LSYSAILLETSDGAEVGQDLKAIDCDNQLELLSEAGAKIHDYCAQGQAFSSEYQGNTSKHCSLFMVISRRFSSL